MAAADVPDNPAAKAADTRLDLHNAEVDEDTAARNLCGMKHLANGEVCRLPHRHTGGCQFGPPVRSS